MMSGFVASLGLVMCGPHIMNLENGWISMEPLFPLYNPGIIAIPLGFIGAWLGTLFSRQSEDEARYISFLVQAQTGVKTEE